MKIIFLLLIAFFYSLESSACVWRRMPTPFWESSRIPVCFVEPHPRPTGEALLMFERAKQITRRAYEREINGRTPYVTFGFENCDYNYHRQGPNQNLPPMIRIEFTSGRGVGSSGSLDGNHGLSFTDSGRVACNIQFDSTIRENGREGPLVPNDERVMEGVALHEFLHLMGVQHEDYSLNDKARNEIINDPHWAIVPPPDSGSIMKTRRREEQTSALTSQDVRCLQLIHSRRILDYLPGGPVRDSTPENSSTDVAP